MISNPTLWGETAAESNAFSILAKLNGLAPVSTKDIETVLMLIYDVIEDISSREKAAMDRLEAACKV